MALMHPSKTIVSGDNQNEGSTLSRLKLQPFQRALARHPSNHQVNKPSFKLWSRVSSAFMLWWTSEHFLCSLKAEILSIRILTTLATASLLPSAAMCSATFTWLWYNCTHSAHVMVRARRAHHTEWAAWWTVVAVTAQTFLHPDVPQLLAFSAAATYTMSQPT